MASFYDEKPLPGDLKRERTADSELDIENNAAVVAEQPVPSETKKFSILGWQVSASRVQKPAPAHTIARKPVGAAAIVDDGQSPTGTENAAAFNPITYRFNRIFPPYKRYCFGRLKRKTFLLVLLGVFLAILAAVIGLGVGLTRPRHRDLPLPTNAQTFTGDLTYYAPALGACGITSSSSDSIVAVSHYVFDAVQTGSNPNANPLCGKKIRATRYNEDVGGQRSVDLTVVDRCVGCEPDDIDVTISAFEQMADVTLGRVKVEWAWLDYTPSS